MLNLGSSFGKICSASLSSGIPSKVTLVPSKDHVTITSAIKIQHHNPKVSGNKRSYSIPIPRYLDTVFPELFIPGEAVAQGELRNPGYSNVRLNNNTIQ